MGVIKKLTMLFAVAVGLLVVLPGGGATAASDWCADSWPYTVPILPAGSPVPVWLAVESRVPSDGTPHVALCYGTGAPGDTKLIGGGAGTHVMPTGSGFDIQVNHESDENGAIEADLAASAWPSVTVSTSGQRGGPELTFRIPVTVCAEALCTPTPEAETGVLVGTAVLTPYGVDQSPTCLKVAGTDTVCWETFGEQIVSTGGQQCLLGNENLCVPLPGNYVKLEGGRILHLYVWPIGVIPVYGVEQCIIGPAGC